MTRTITIVLLLTHHVSSQQQVPLSDLMPDVGPIAVAADGSLHRIANWQELTENEREAARKALARRNSKRLAKLRTAEKEASDSKARHPLHSVQRWLSRLWLRRLAKVDFAPEFVAIIENGTKRATTRLISSEPHLDRLSAGRRVRATCRRCGGEARVGFATLRVTSIEQRSFSELDAALAAIENFEDADALRGALMRFYPSLRNESNLTVFHFERLPSAADAASEPPAKRSGLHGGKQMHVGAAGGRSGADRDTLETEQPRLTMEV